MAIFPFVVLKYIALRHDSQIMNHECIHLRQQVELLIIPFYFLYLLNYLINLIYYRNHFLAYRNIMFEREAYENDTNHAYLTKRRFASWINYIRKAHTKTK